MDADSKVADMLRRSKKPVVLVVNKVDSFEKYMADVYEFYNLGIGDPIPISAASMLGLGDMLDEVIEHFPEDAGADEDQDDVLSIAIVGKPNVGKSSLVNKSGGREPCDRFQCGRNHQRCGRYRGQVQWQGIYLYRYGRIAPQEQDQGRIGALQYHPYCYCRRTVQMW